MQETYFYVGQTVYTVEYGKGKVISINNDLEFSVKVEFNSLKESYTFDGRLTSALNISLFQQPITLPTNKPIITLKKGDLVWVKDYEENKWECRYFSHFADFSRTKIACFDDQQKYGDVYVWRFWSEFENIPF